MSPTWRKNLIAALLISITALFVAKRWQVSTDIAEFLPSGDDQRRAALARSIAGSELSRSLVLSIEGDSAETAVAASKALEAKLRDNADLMSRLAFISGGPPTATDESLWKLYQPRRLAFAARTPEAAKQLVSDTGLDAAVAELRSKLESPLSTVVSRVAPEDPLLAVPHLLEGMVPSGSQISIVDGRFIAEERHSLLILGTHASAFDADAQRAVLAPVEESFRQIAAAQGGGLRLEMAGLSRFAVRAQETIQSDLQRISVLSVLGMLGVCLVLFRSLHLVLLPWLPIGCGMLGGAAACLLLYGSIHGITLAIGSSLMGVCIDYITHFYVHHLLAPKGTLPSTTMRRVWMGLLLGGLTTVTGFALLAGSSFPGLGQIAAFSSVGIAVSLIATRFLVPQCMPRNPRSPALLGRLAQRLNGSIEQLQRSRRAVFILPVLAVLASGFGFYQVRWDDDMSQLAVFDPQLTAEDQRVRERLGQVDQSRFVVAWGADEERALIRNDAILQILAAARSANEVTSFQSIATLLPSAQSQQATFEVLRGANLRERLGRRLVAAGFNDALFAPFFDALDQAPPPPLHYADLAQSEVVGLVRQFRIQFDGQVGFVTFLRGVHDPKTLAERFKSSEGVLFLDQAALMKSATGQYNRRAAQLLTLGVLAVLVILWLRYRRLSVALATLLPAALAGGVAVLSVSLFGLELDALGLTALLMVLSMGVDYSVFMAEAAGYGGEDEDGGEMGATVLGVIVDWFTTVFGFGVLAFAHYPAMRIIGIVAGVGITAALVLAPTTLALVSPPPGNAERKHAKLRAVQEAAK